MPPIPNISGATVLSSLPAHWKVEVHCGTCTKSTAWKLADLARYGHPTLSQMAERLRCAKCQARWPIAILTVEGAPGEAKPWPPLWASLRELPKS